MKKLPLFLSVFFACLILFSGCAKNSEPEKENEATSSEAEQNTSTEPNVSTETSTSAEPSTSKESDSKEKEGKPSTGAMAYSPLLEEYYQFIQTYDYNSENDNTEIDEGKSAIWEMFMVQEREDILNSVGYAMMDVNGDEVPELFIGTVDSESGTMEIGFIHAVFTLNQNRPQLLLAGNPRDQFFYLGEGEFANQNATGGDYSLILFKMDKDKAILEPKGLYFSQEEDASGETVGYYYSSSVDFDINKAEKLEPEQFRSTIETITSRVVAPEYTPFSADPNE